jgi:putative addiction module killer protein
MTADGKALFRKRFAALRDRKAQARIDARLARVQLGNLGQCEPLGDGVTELKIDYGPGYRSTSAKWDLSSFSSCVRGDKRTQQRDSEAARTYWAG